MWIRFTVRTAVEVVGGGGWGGVEVEVAERRDSLKLRVRLLRARLLRALEEAKVRSVAVVEAQAGEAEVVVMCLVGKGCLRPWLKVVLENNAFDDEIWPNFIV
ncbi:hypothetical protein F0562_008127 [Nyssa sinensis]|uniref:Uncharacterized protein n=1 Tax=Nyssa sinensis TaxID=561372 RepID=A0A5J5A845_9ASTE|nr:hypothetical protein F0562_008127 [Nyssa sinensis]